MNEPTRRCKKCRRMFYIRRPWQQLCPFHDGQDQREADHTEEEYRNSILAGMLYGSALKSAEGEK